MRPAPPLQVSVDRFFVWRALVLVVMAVVAATGIAWQVALHEDAALAGGMARVGVGAAMLAGLGGAATLLKQRPFSLRWDGKSWHLGPAGSAGREAVSGRLRVAVDVGVWMLLRLDAESTGRLPRPHWLPVQRSALPHAWHALRCAVYSPRPESGDLLSDQRDHRDSASTPPTRHG